MTQVYSKLHGLENVRQNLRSAVLYLNCVCITRQNIFQWSFIEWKVQYSVTLKESIDEQ